MYNIFEKIALHGFQGGKFSSPTNLGLGSALEINQIRFRRRRESPPLRILQQHWGKIASSWGGGAKGILVTNDIQPLLGFSDIIQAAACSWHNFEKIPVLVNIARGTTDPGYWVCNLNDVFQPKLFQIGFSQKLVSSYRLNTLGPLCLWQCFLTISLLWLLKQFLGSNKFLGQKSFKKL